jgi:hypothetical protein
MPDVVDQEALIIPVDRQGDGKREELGKGFDLVPASALQRARKKQQNPVGQGEVDK